MAWVAVLQARPSKSYAMACQSLTKHVVDVQRICLKCVPLIQSLHCRFPQGQMKAVKRCFSDFLTKSARSFAKKFACTKMSPYENSDTLRVWAQPQHPWGFLARTQINQIERKSVYLLCMEVPTSQCHSS